MKIKFVFLLVSTLAISKLTFAKQPTEVNTVMQLTQQLQAQKGKVVYIDFWSSWCVPCRESFPWMNKLQRKYQQQGLTILSINLDHDRKLADEFLIENPALFPVIYDPKGLIARKYKLRGMPSSFIINRTGQIVSAHVGFNKQKSLAYEQEIIQLLNMSVTLNP
ncbi:TlpA disulfide reductase family protein [Cognaticolwellia mytili]|uniref:TlpA disulfide reductase family protein n=1 Tax=Cognaticolwellia mytili TaxID=1888913 RepID=UPI001F23DD9C|nr:TlpA disulfide reductase family protein [Cognaticolwellia mytili]